MSVIDAPAHAPPRSPRLRPSRGRRSVRRSASRRSSAASCPPTTGARSACSTASTASARTACMMIRAKLPGGIVDARAARGARRRRRAATAAARATSRRGRTSSTTSCRWPTSRPRCASSPTPASRRRKRAATRCATGRAARSPASRRTSRSIRRRTSRARAPPAARPVQLDAAAQAQAVARRLLRHRLLAGVHQRPRLPRAQRRTASSASSCSPAAVCRRCAARRSSSRSSSRVAEIFEAADAIVRVFHRIGNRNNKAKARLKWAIDKIGAEAFLAEYHAERETIRAEGGVPLVLPEQPAAAGAPRAARAGRRRPTPGYAEWAADSVRPQKQDGFSAIVIRLILGDITATQLRALAQLADAVRRGRSPPDERAEHRAALGARRATARAPPRARAHRPREVGANTLADVTSCPGATSCKLAVTSSKGLAGDADRAARSPPRSRARARRASTSRSRAARTAAASTTSPASASRAACASSPARPAPQYLVYVGGGIRGDGADFGRLVGKVPARRVGADARAPARLLHRGRRHEPQVLEPTSRSIRCATLIADLTKIDDATATAEDFVDHRRGDRVRGHDRRRRVRRLALAASATSSRSGASR